MELIPIGSYKAVSVPFTTEHGTESVQFGTAKSGTDLKAALDRLKTEAEKQRKAAEELLAQWKKMNPGNVD